MPPFDASYDFETTTRSAQSAADAVWFGPPEAPLFGMFHRAVGSGGDAVVVLCQPFGYDAGTVHYAYKKLAEQLASAGISALRFDYAGTGNSSGDDEDPARVAAWLESIGPAVAEARRLSGARRVILFGVRFGALLATAYAQSHPVDGLVLLGPPRSGSTFIRELSAIQRMRTVNPGEGASDDITFSEDENLGFPLPPELRAEMADLDPYRCEEPPAPQALVIARDDIPGPEVRLVEHLRRVGVTVEHDHSPGYTKIFEFGEIPPETVERIASFIAPEPPRSFSTTPLGATPPVATAPRAATFEGLTEEAMTFGGLFGVVTRPGPGAASSVRVRDTAILLLGTGANQHMGVSRLHVRFARDWAKRGFEVLRFDLSGVGESPTLPGQEDRRFYTAQAVPETRRAIDAMIARGARRVILVGLCSGGYTAFHTAVHDTRVAAIAAVNVPGFHYHPADSLGLAANRPGLRRLVRGALAARWQGKAVALRDAVDDVARGFGTLLARGGRALVVYGSGDSGLPVFQRHLGMEPQQAAAPALQGLDLAVIRACDHTFTPRAAQKRLQTLVTRLIDGGFP
jgi:alpha-beta hydrolase superfamily lysophospholipase